MKKLIPFLLTLVMVCTLGVAAFAETKLLDPVYFAWVGPLSGDSTLDGLTEQASLEMCLEHINGNGGVLGHKLVIDFFDDKNDATEAVNIANKIVDAEKYIAVMGSWSSTPSMAMAPIFEENQIIQYSPTASHADYSSLGKYIFRNTPTQALETAAYAEYIAKNTDIKTVAILYQNDDWGLNINNIFTKNFEELGGKVVLSETFIGSSTKDFTPMITKVKELKPDAFFIVAYYSDSAQIMVQTKDLDYPGQIVITSTCLKQETINISGKAAEGALLFNCFAHDIPSERFQKIMEGEFRERTGKLPDAFAMQPYDVCTQLVKACEDAGTVTDIPAIRDALDGMTFEGLAGEYTMNEVGDAVRPLFPITIRNGAFVTITD